MEIRFNNSLVVTLLHWYTSSDVINKSVISLIRNRSYRDLPVTVVSGSAWLSNEVCDHPGFIITHWLRSPVACGYCNMTLMTSHKIRVVHPSCCLVWYRVPPISLTKSSQFSKGLRSRIILTKNEERKEEKEKESKRERQIKRNRKRESKEERKEEKEKENERERQRKRNRKRESKEERKEEKEKESERERQRKRNRRRESKEERKEENEKESERERQRKWNRKSNSKEKRRKKRENVRQREKKVEYDKMNNEGEK